MANRTGEVHAASGSAQHRRCLGNAWTVLTRCSVWGVNQHAEDRYGGVESADANIKTHVPTFSRRSGHGSFYGRYK